MQIKGSLTVFVCVICVAFISDFAKFGFSLAVALLPLVRIGPRSLYNAYTFTFLVGISTN